MARSVSDNHKMGDPPNIKVDVLKYYTDQKQDQWKKRHQGEIAFRIYPVTLCISKNLRLSFGNIWFIKGLKKDDELSSL